MGYDTESLKSDYTGEVTTDRNGRKIPKHAHGTANLEWYTASTRLLTETVLRLFDRVVDKDLLARLVYLTARQVLPEAEVQEKSPMEEIPVHRHDGQSQGENTPDKERRMQEAMLQIKRKYGKNAILKGVSYQNGATGRERNELIPKRKGFINLLWLQ